MHAGTAAAAAAGVPATAGMWLFSYNKDNFQYDAGMRFGRFTMSRTFANAQVGQYREDIHGITEATVSKMDAWQTITVCFLQVCAALSCAGRVGMHGAAPPGWLCALFSGCIFMSTLFCGLSLWLSMHASLRAQCAQVSLLTRKVRLPIPSLNQLDKARVFASAYEKQEYRDIFRVPFMRHPEETPDVPGEGPTGRKKKKRYDPYGVHDPHAEFASSARDTVPSWIRDEVAMDKGGEKVEEASGETHQESEAPTHFKLLMQAQEEWRDYDVYARISMLYGVCSFLYATCYFGIATTISELRGFWVMWSLPMIFMTAQALILRLDILRTGMHRLPGAEYLGHVAPYFAVAGCTLEYKFYFSEMQLKVTWALVMLAFFSHFMMALRFLDLAWPEASVTGDMPEEPGKQWWPGDWKIPQAFRKHLWFITPPKKLEANQHCLVHEMEDMAANAGGLRKRKGNKVAATKSGESSHGVGADSSNRSGSSNLPQKRPNDMPWQMLRIACCSAALGWAFMMGATVVEYLLGPESLLKPPGEPPWIRDTKFRSWTPAKMHASNSAGLPTDYRLFSASEAYYEDAADSASSHKSSHDDGHGGSHRRLSDTNKTAATQALRELVKALPVLEELADRVSNQEVYGAPASLAAPSGFMAAGPRSMDVTWPPLFEPKHILCGYQAGTPDQVVALTGRGFGAIVPVAHSGGSSKAESFSLVGLDAMGPLAGASWSRHGLRLVTTAGKILHCPGSRPVMSTWFCSIAEHVPLLMTGSDVLAAAFTEGRDDAEKASSKPLLALVLKSLPKMVALYTSDGGKWAPTGEVHLPFDADHHLGLNFHDDDLLISSATGEVRRHSLTGASPSVMSAPPPVPGRHFSSACPTSADGLVRLGTRTASGNGAALGPELLFSD